MKTIILKNPCKKLVNVLIGIKVGWRHEPEGKKGISHFTEHLIFEGNENYPEPDNFAKSYGIEIDGMTLFENTLFYFTAKKENWKDIFEMLLSIIFYPSLSKKFKEIKENEILTAIIQESDYTPWELAYEWAHNLVFETDFRKSLGTKENLNLIEVNDVKEWHKKYYHTENSFIVVNGDVEKEEVKNLISKMNLPDKGEKPEIQHVFWKEKCKKIKFNTHNVEMVLGAKVDYHPGWQILLEIIGGCSPIKEEWKNIFGKYTYTMETKLINHLVDSGIFLYFGCTSYKNAEKIREILPDYLKNMQIHKEEIELAKKRVEIKILNTLEDGENAVLEIPLKINPRLQYMEPERYLNEIKRVTVEEIEKLKDKFCASLKYVVMVGAVC